MLQTLVVGSQRMTMKVESPLSCQCQLAATPPARAKGARLALASRPMLTALLSILIAFFPKCAVCWATYMSVFGSVWLARMPYFAWLYPVLLGLSALNLLLLLKRAPKNGYGPLLLSLSGIAVIIGGRSLFPQERWILVCGMALMVATSLVSSFTVDRFKSSILQLARKESQS